MTTTTRSIIRRTTILKAELAENSRRAEFLVNENFPVLLFCNKLTNNLRMLAKHPLVQIRFTRHDDLKGLLIV